MTQFTVFKNKNPASKSRVPYLLDIQSGLLETLDTRLVIPLSPLSSLKGKTLGSLTPVIEIEGKQFLLLTLQMAGISRNDIGVAVTDLSPLRHEIIAAIDFLISGI